MTSGDRSAVNRQYWNSDSDLVVVAGQTWIVGLVELAADGSVLVSQVLDPEGLWHHPSPYPLHCPCPQKLAEQALELESRAAIVVAVALIESPQPMHLLAASVSLVAVMAVIVGSAAVELVAELPTKPELR